MQGQREPTISLKNFELELKSQWMRVEDLILDCFHDKQLFKCTSSQKFRFLALESHDHNTCPNITSRHQPCVRKNHIWL
jgi:hypothetical protein